MVIPSSIVYEGESYPVTALGFDCLDSCYELKSVIIPTSVKKIDDMCFANCTSLTSVTIPNSVTFMGKACFKNCSALTTITIPNSLNVLEASCFADCKALGTVAIPSTIETLSNSCFAGCESLEVIEIPNSVKTMEAYCFSRCTGLVSVRIPQSVTKLEKECFAGCTKLRTLAVDWQTPATIGDDCFKGTAVDTLIVSQNTKALYMGNTAWADFDNIVENSVTGCKGLVQSGTLAVNQSAGTITISGITDCNDVYLYNIGGGVIGKEHVQNGSVTFSTSDVPGVVITKIGGKTLKIVK